MDTQRRRAHGYPRKRLTAAVAAVMCLSATLLSAAQSQLDDAHISPTFYFPSAADESSSRAALHSGISVEVEALRSTPVRLLVKQLDRCETLIAALQTHSAFLKVQALENTLDQPAKQARNQVVTDQSVLEAAMDTRLRRLSPTEVDSLGRYKFMAQNARLSADHARSPDTEQYSGGVVPPTLTSFADAYDRIDEHLTRPKDVNAADTATRRAAVTQWNETYDKAAPEEAVLLAAIVELENRDAVARGYKNAADRKYQERNLSDALVEQTLAAVQVEAPAYRRYQEVLASHAAAKLGISPVFSTDIALASTHPPVTSFPDAKHLILDSLAPLGTDYTRRFAALLDPANGRLDLAGGAHRARTGTSIHVFDAPTALYYSGYDGSLQQISVIAHEGGHAIHHELMNAGGNPVYERAVPSFCSEGFAIFNELLLLDHATEVAKTPADKESALERLLNKISLELFVSAEETAFERSLYTDRAGKPLLNRAQIDSLYQASIQTYEIWPTADVGQSRIWMRKPLLFEDPLYLVNYLYASVIAVALYDKSHTDPDFVAKYEALLRRGSDAEPQTLLASIGIRLDDSNLVKPAARLLVQKTEELQNLYTQIDGHISP